MTQTFRHGVVTQIKETRDGGVGHITPMSTQSLKVKTNFGGRGDSRVGKDQSVVEWGGEGNGKNILLLENQHRLVRQ